MPGMNPLCPSARWRRATVRRAPSRLSDYPFVIVRVGSQFCPRQGAYCLARLAAKYGPEIDLWALLDVLASDCCLHRSPGERGPGKYDAKCGAYTDLGRPVPPDLGRRCASLELKRRKPARPPQRPTLPFL